MKFKSHHIITVFIFLIIIGIFTAPRIIDGLTSVESLKNKCLEKRYEELFQTKDGSKSVYGFTNNFLVKSYEELFQTKYGPKTVDGFTNKFLLQRYEDINVTTVTVDNLTNYIHEETKYKHSGAICYDGWISHSTGRGTCAWHGGVAYWFSKGDYSKSMKECRDEAKEIIEECRNEAKKIVEECRNEAIKIIEECKYKAKERSWIDN